MIMLELGLFPSVVSATAASMLFWCVSETISRLLLSQSCVHALLLVRFWDDFASVIFWAQPQSCVHALLVRVWGLSSGLRVSMGSYRGQRFLMSEVPL